VNPARLRAVSQASRFSLLSVIVLGAAALAPVAPAAVTGGAAIAWLHGDAPIWDIADEGLPLRCTLALPSRRDPLARALYAAETRWTFSAGYARVYNSYDPTTGIFKNPGGHAALISVGRQFRWRRPPPAGAALPQLAIELGAHAATRRFPADGTRANVKLITGLEWVFREATPREWSVGLMWMHFSNANLFSRNAGYDGLALRVGRRL
jgi:hypothetical protein